MNKLKIVWLWLFLFLSGCATTGTTLTPLEIQSMQTREFEHEKSIVFASTMSVFQDLGYIIQSADKETGLITAEGIASSNAALRLFTGLTEVTQTKATAFIEQIGAMTRVRLNFVTSSTQSSKYGQADRQDTPILDPKIYENAFERIDNAIFVRSSN